MTLEELEAENERLRSLLRDAMKEEESPKWGLTPQQWQIYNYLKARAGRIVTWEDFFNLLWADKPDSEWPEDSNQVIQVQMCKIRRKAPSWATQAIKNVHGYGYTYRSSDNEAQASARAQPLDNAS